MKRNLRLLCMSMFMAMALQACVTTTTGDIPPRASKEEAARINRDLGLAYLRQGDLDQALVKLEKSIEEDPDNATAHRALGLVYERLDELKGAEREYRTAFKLAPDDPDVVSQLAVYLCLHGDAGEAFRLFDRAAAIPLNQRRYIIYTNAGTCAKREGDLPRAESYLRQALALDPAYPDALLQMSDVAYRRDNHLQARAFIDRYLAAGPASPAALWLGHEIELALNNRSAANDYAKRLLRDFPESVEARRVLEQRRNAG